MSAQQPTSDEHVLTVHCPEAYGLVSAVASNLTEQGCDIFDVKHFSDRHNDEFFIRCHTMNEPGTVTTESLIEGFRPVAEKHDMRFRLVDARHKTRVLVMVSKISHCLVNLLHRARVGSLPIEIVGVVSNHTDLQPLVDFYGVPFHHVPVTRHTKPQAEAQLLEIAASYDTELVVLARYMQILSDEPGLRARGQDGRGHRPLCHPGPGRGSDHRAARDPGGSRAHPGGPRGGGFRGGDPGPVPRREVARGGSRGDLRQSDHRPGLSPDPSHGPHRAPASRPAGARLSPRRTAPLSLTG